MKNENENANEPATTWLSTKCFGCGAEIAAGGWVCAPCGEGQLEQSAADSAAELRAERFYEERGATGDDEAAAAPAPVVYWPEEQKHAAARAAAKVMPWDTAAYWHELARDERAKAKLDRYTRATAESAIIHRQNADEYQARGDAILAAIRAKNGGGS